MEKINVETFSQSIEVKDESGNCTIGMTNYALEILASKVNEIVDWINKEKELETFNKDFAVHDAESKMQ